MGHARMGSRASGEMSPRLCGSAEVALLLFFPDGFEGVLELFQVVENSGSDLARLF